jgi:hypothetical protein
MLHEWEEKEEEEEEKDEEKKMKKRRRMHIGYWWESQNVRDHGENQEVGGWTLLK